MTETIGKHRRIGVCSWSLRPRDAFELARSVAGCGLSCVQLALSPVRAGAMPVAEIRAALAAAGIHAISGMMSTIGEDYSSLDSIARTGGLRPDVHWAANLGNAKADARIARELDLPLVTFHAGFLPHERADPERPKLLVRLRTVVDVFADEGVRLGFETGQETAATLADLLDELDRPTAGINFDPANMILYGMGDPIVALRRLGPRVVQVHVKDARPPARRGEWGEEVPVGTGAVDWPDFLAALEDVQPRVDLVIEREAGEARVADVRRAHAHVLALLGAAA